MGNVLSASFVWSTNPPKTSSPPNANIAKVINENICIIDWYSGLGDWVKDLIIPSIGRANSPPFKIKLKKYLVNTFN